MGGHDLAACPHRLPRCARGPQHGPASISRWDILGSVELLQDLAETYRFECLRCSSVWKRTYSVRQAVTRDGEAEVVYFLRGTPVPAPTGAPSCIRCGGLRVRVRRL